MGLHPVAGARIFIGGAIADKNADFVASDFASQSWTEIDGWSSTGAIGDGASEIATDLINRGRTIVQKGTRRSPAMENRFAIVPGDAGQVALKAAERSKDNFAFKIEWNDAPTVRSFAVTISNASPGVVTKVAHGLVANTPVVFSTTGALPTGLTAGVTYYVKTVLDADTFTVSATPGGTVVNTSSVGSGTHTLTTAPVGSQTLFIALVMTAQEQGGEANTVRNLNATLAPNSNIVSVASLG